MRRITISVADDVPDLVAIEKVRRVIENGRMSDDGKCYCYLTSFEVSKIVVVAHLTRTGNDAFHVYDKRTMG